MHIPEKGRGGACDTTHRHAHTHTDTTPPHSPTHFLRAPFLPAGACQRGQFPPTRAAGRATAPHNPRGPAATQCHRPTPPTSPKTQNTNLNLWSTGLCDFGTIGTFWTEFTELTRRNFSTDLFGTLFGTLFGQPRFVPLSPAHGSGRGLAAEVPTDIDRPATYSLAN